MQNSVWDTPVNEKDNVYYEMNTLLCTFWEDAVVYTSSGVGGGDAKSGPGSATWS